MGASEQRTQPRIKDISNMKSVHTQRQCNPDQERNRSELQRERESHG